CSFLTELPAVLVDARERNTKRVVVVKIPAANDCNVLRDAYSLVESIIHNPHSQRVIEAKHSVRPGLKTEELAHGVCAALLGFNISLAFRNDVIINDFQPGLHQRLPVPFQAAYACASFGPANMRYSLASNVDQVFRGQSS